MGLFDQFPYTNFHELNLDWILKALKELEHTIEQFVAINALKYADPIQWNITRQYEKNTIVIDPLTGTAYISVQPVPSGVALTNEDYWTVVFDLGSFVTRAAKNFTIRYEDATTLTATFSSTAGEWLVWGDTLYVANVNITAGDSYVESGNITHITMEDIIGHLADLNTADKNNLVSAINELVTSIATINSNIGDLSTLTTTDTSSIVNAINSLVTIIGDLSTLATTDKSSVVNAINEVNAGVSNVDNKVGDLNDLNTTDKSSIINAINEIQGSLSSIDSTEWVNVKKYGAVGDGVTDDTNAINAAIAELNSRAKGALYFPAGNYLITSALSPITTNFDLFGAGKGSTIITSNITTPNEIVFTCGGVNIHSYSIHDIQFRGSEGSTETWIQHIVGNYVTVHDIKIHNIYKFISIGDGVNASISFFIYNVLGWTRNVCVTHNGHISGVYMLSCNIDNSPQHTSTFFVSPASSGTFDTFYMENCVIVGYTSSISINATDTTKSNIFIYNNIFDVNQDRCVNIGLGANGHIIRVYMKGNWFTSSDMNCVSIAGNSGSLINQIEICNNKFLEANWNCAELQYCNGVIITNNQCPTFNKANNNLPAFSVRYSERVIISDNLMTNNIGGSGHNQVGLIVTNNNYLIVTDNICDAMTTPIDYNNSTNVIIKNNLGIADI